MTVISAIPVAQYLRKSTERQQYSLENQADAIQQYAAQNGMTIVETYSDKTSGMALRRRKGLQRLLHDVTKGKPSYKVILVYDVTRWGRFLDADESAYYEFLCKIAGIRVHYCAEQFSNDGTLVSVLVKSMKRMMAAEYIRELSTKIIAGSRRIAELGFKCGGAPGFGLRRMLVSKDGQPKTLLGYGERKSIQDDRVLLVRGPEEEVQCVREIYQMFLDGKGALAIANELNSRGIKYPGTKRTRWYEGGVNHILRSPKYKGCAAYGRTSQRLNTPRISLPEDTWVITPRAWEGIVDAETFSKVQRKFESRSKFISDDQLLDSLRQLKAREGSLRVAALTPTSGLPSVAIYRRRFGSFSNAADLTGCEPPRAPRIAIRRSNISLRAGLMDEIVKQSNQKVSIVQRASFRPKLRLRNRTLVSVYLCMQFTQSGNSRWLLKRAVDDPDRVTLVVRLDPTNQAFQDFYVIAKIPRRCYWTIKPDDAVLIAGMQLKTLAEFVSAVLEVQKAQAGQ